MLPPPPQQPQHQQQPVGPGPLAPRLALGRCLLLLPPRPPLLLLLLLSPLLTLHAGGAFALQRCTLQPSAALTQHPATWRPCILASFWTNGSFFLFLLRTGLLLSKLAGMGMSSHSSSTTSNAAIGGAVGRLLPHTSACVDSADTHIHRPARGSQGIHTIAAGRTHPLLLSTHTYTHTHTHTQDPDTDTDRQKPTNSKKGKSKEGKGKEGKKQQKEKQQQQSSLDDAAVPEHLQLAARPAVRQRQHKQQQRDKAAAAAAADKAAADRQAARSEGKAAAAAKGNRTSDRATAGRHPDYPAGTYSTRQRRAKAAAAASSSEETASSSSEGEGSSASMSDSEA
jgi:hypothetical protein